MTAHGWPVWNWIQAAFETARLGIPLALCTFSPSWSDCSHVTASVFSIIKIMAKIA